MVVFFAYFLLCRIFLTRLPLWLIPMSRPNLSGRKRCKYAKSCEVPADCSVLDDLGLLLRIAKGLSDWSDRRVDSIWHDCTTIPKLPPCWWMLFVGTFFTCGLLCDGASFLSNSDLSTCCWVCLWRPVWIDNGPWLLDAFFRSIKDDNVEAIFGICAAKLSHPGVRPVWIPDSIDSRHDFSMKSDGRLLLTVVIRDLSKLSLPRVGELTLSLGGS